MIADRFEITDTNGLRIDGIPWRERGLLVQYAAIRQQASDIDQLRADLAAAVAERDKLRAIDCGWIAGQPPRYIGEEWFIAKTIHSERVVLRALGDGHSYDYTTADGTYMRAKNIVKWMQFPDSQYKSAAIAEITVRAEQAEARLAAIEAAPTVCEIVAVRERPHIHMIADAPPIGTELIARPAKD